MLATFSYIMSTSPTQLSTGLCCNLWFSCHWSCFLQMLVWLLHCAAPLPLCWYPLLTVKQISRVFSYIGPKCITLPLCWLGCFDPLVAHCSSLCCPLVTSLRYYTCCEGLCHTLLSVCVIQYLEPSYMYPEFSLQPSIANTNPIVI